MNFEVGDTVFVRANTRDDYVGRIVDIPGPFTVVLDQCSWVASSGRFNEFIQRGEPANRDNLEIEPMGDGVAVNWSLIMRWPHKLFTEPI